MLLDDERKEYADAAVWYRRSAAQGFLLAKVRVLLNESHLWRQLAMQSSCIFTTNDIRVFVGDFSRACENTVYCPHQRRLANLLRFGKGSTDDDIHRQFVSRNTAEAVALYREAAARGDPEAQFVLAQVRAHIRTHARARTLTLARQNHGVKISSTDSTDLFVICHSHSFFSAAHNSDRGNQ